MSWTLATRFDLDDPELVATVDDLPLWSAPFGLALLKVVGLARNLRVLDIGFGTGFPLLELAQRLGSSSQVIGLDPWRGGHDLVRRKMVQYGIDHVELVQGTAERMPFPNEHFGLLVSNNGLSNVTDLDAALGECHRVCEPGGQLVATHNLPETMHELYGPFEETLTHLGLDDALDRLRQHIHEKRKPVGEMCDRLVRQGFEVRKVIEEEFQMRYLDGSTMLRHYLIRLGFLESWKAVLDPAHVVPVLTEITERLDGTAAQQGELRLTVPFVCIDCLRVESGRVMGP